MIFKTYNNQGQTLLDSQTAVFTLIQVGKLTRLLNKDFANNKREYWYRAKRLGINSTMRQGFADIHSKEYCMYYLDVPNAISPIVVIYYGGLAKDCEPVALLNAGQFEGKTRLMFYSNGRLSDEQLDKYRIYVFDTVVQRETQVGINLYDKQGKVTFSNKNTLLNLVGHTVNITPLSSQQYQERTIMSAQIYNQMTNAIYGIEAEMNEEFPKPAPFYAMLNQVRASLLYPIQQELDNDFNRAGFTKVGNGYLRSVTKPVGGFADTKLSIMQNRVYEDSSEIPEPQYAIGQPIPSIMRTISMISVGCVDGLFVCPTVEFADVSTDGSKKSVDVSGAVIKSKRLDIRFVYVVLL